MKTNSFRMITGIVALIIYSGTMFSQRTIKVKNFIENLPKIELKENTPQKYIMVTDNKDYDIYGNFRKKTRISGEYTRGLKNDSVIWNNVRIAQSQKLYEPFTAGIVQNYMENFTYIPSGEIIKESFFKEIPKIDVQMKTLVWDMFTFELYAWNFWDQLKLNLEYPANQINFAVQIEGIGAIENKDVRITWTGITKKNGKLCAIITFIALNNPLNFDIQNIIIKGRTHYWGNIYVSLSDKQIEFGELHEDILMDVIMNEQEPGKKSYSTRKITLDRIH